MPTNFKPVYTITSSIAKYLMRIEAAKEKVHFLPVNPTVLASLRETAKLYTTHYSTMIEGNKLNADEVKEVVSFEGHFPGRERDEKEVRGYYAALAQLEQYAAQNHPVTEKITIVPRRRFRWHKRSLFLESLYLSRLALTLRADIWHSSYYVGFPLLPKVKRILMFYDMIPETTKEQTPYLTQAKERSIMKSDVVHPISHHSLLDLQKFYPSLTAKTEVIHLFQRASRVQVDQNPLPFPYFLYVGRRGEYKNFASCLEQILEEQEYSHIHIVAVGDGNWKEEEQQIIDRFQASKRMHNLGIIEPERLEGLIKNAMLLLYPSLYEGFGLPILEAFQHHVPVLACRTSSIPEVTGIDYPLCTIDDPSSWKTTLHELIKNRAKWSEHRKNRLKNFSAQKTVEQITSLYETFPKCS